MCRTDNAVKNHWNSTLKRRRAEYAPGGPLDVSAITAALQRRLASAGTEDGEQKLAGILSWCPTWGSLLVYKCNRHTVLTAAE